jgi:hypothetical protein
LREGDGTHLLVHPPLPATAALTRHLPDEFRRRWGLGMFNDAPTTTHADIMALFDRAIAAEEASE